MTQPESSLPTPASTPPPAAETERRPVLLLVDDQPINIMMLSPAFEDEHDVLIATSGRQAIQLCREGNPDLILLDVMMPEMDGYEVCRVLKEDPATCDIPIIFVTGQSDPDEEAKGLDEGAVDYIQKPVNLKVVRARVRAHLSLRLADQRIHALNASLERRVEERTAALQLATRDLGKAQEELAHSEARATLATLIASVSHELATPIGNGMLLASALAEQAGGFRRLVDQGMLKRADLNALMETLTDSASMMMINMHNAENLLKNFKQVAADQASEQRRLFDLGSQVREIINVMTPKLKRHPHKVLVDIPPGILMDSYPGPLGQVIINLINNAYLHGFEGRHEGEFSISASVVGSDVQLVCHDNGVGMSEENLANIFHPFFSTKIGDGGTGLGMTIVENLLRKSLGGSLIVHTALGVGTSFEIYFPLTAPGRKRPA